MRNTISLCLALSVFLFFLGCFESDKMTGTGSQSGNAIHGMVTNSTGDAAANVSVTIYPRGFNTLIDTLPKEWSTQTDDEGAYLFKDMTAGTYNIQAFNAKDSTTSLLRDIQILKEKKEKHSAPSVPQSAGFRYHINHRI